MPTASSRKYRGYSRTSNSKLRLFVATERQTGTRVHASYGHGYGFDLHIRPAPGNGRTEAGIRSCPGSAGKFRSQVAAPDRIVRVVASGSSAESSLRPAHSISPKRIREARYACAGLRLPAKNQEMAPRAQVRLSMSAQRFFDPGSRRSGLFAYFCLQTTRVC